MDGKSDEEYDDEEEAGPLPVVFRDLGPENEPQLRHLNKVVFPVAYSVRTPAPCVAYTGVGTTKVRQGNLHQCHGDTERFKNPARL